MKELQAIINAQDNLNKKTALVTVVHVEGSSYRRAGARMLITEDGEMIGSISGGCLEGDALRKALLSIHSGKNMLVTYDTSDEDDAIMGMGLGCNGVIQVLIEPIDPANKSNAVNLLKIAVKIRQSSVLITLFSLQGKQKFQPGTCLVVTEKAVSGNAPVINETLTRDGQLALKNCSSSFKNYTFSKDNYTAFIEYIVPPPSLIIIGEGNDVLPLVQMADVLGWLTTVIHGRTNYPRKDRFTASCRLLVSKPEDVLGKLDIDDKTVFLLMTHNYNYDIAILRALLTKNVAYIGTLGPQKKLDRMLDQLKAEGITVSEEQLSRIYGPVGLDIGAESPEEIALSVLAEIKAVLSCKKGHSLRTNTGAIHSRQESLIEQVHVHSQ